MSQAAHLTAGIVLYFGAGIVGFNEAWDIMRKYMKAQIARAALQEEPKP